MTATEILGKLAEEAEAGALDPAEAERPLAFFRQFADRCHHGKEERELFPALEAAGVPRKDGPVGAMLAEHELGRAAVRAMVSALASLAGGESAGAKAFAAAAGDYRAILSGHIDFAVRGSKACSMKPFARAPGRVRRVPWRSIPNRRAPERKWTVYNGACD